MAGVGSPGGFEITRRNRCQFVVLFDIVIIEVAEYLHLITTDLVAKGRITTPSFLLRDRNLRTG